MPRGDKSAYTSKQKRQAEHIEDGAKKSGKSAKIAERIAWATVNKQDHGGKKSGSGRGTKRSTASSKLGGKHSHSGSAYTKSGAKKTATAKTSTAKRSPARKSPARKSPARKSPARKSRAKK